MGLLKSGSSIYTHSVHKVTFICNLLQALNGSNDVSKVYTS